MEILGNVVALEMENNLSKVTPITKCLVVLTKHAWPAVPKQVQLLHFSFNIQRQRSGA